MYLHTFYILDGQNRVYLFQAMPVLFGSFTFFMYDISMTLLPQYIFTNLQHILYLHTLQNRN